MFGALEHLQRDCDHGDDRGNRKCLHRGAPARPRLPHGELAQSRAGQIRIDPGGLCVQDVA